MFLLQETGVDLLKVGRQTATNTGDPEQDDTASDEGKGSNTWLIVSVVIGAVAAVVCVVVILTCFVKKGKK